DMSPRRPASDSVGKSTRHSSRVCGVNVSPHVPPQMRSITRYTPTMGLGGTPPALLPLCQLCPCGWCVGFRTNDVLPSRSLRDRTSSGRNVLSTNTPFRLRLPLPNLWLEQRSLLQPPHLTYSSEGLQILSTPSAAVRGSHW